MAKRIISEGVLHKLPVDFRDAIIGSSEVFELWENITPLARNEWICWIESAKKDETRKRRIAVGISKLSSGMKRPCCWAGCSHREKSWTV